MQTSAPRAIAAAPLADAGPFAYAMAMPPLYPSNIPFHSPSPVSSQRAPIGSSRSGVCASRHMAAEQRRRARINERLEALRNVVPHSARANTAAFLTEVYDYISTLHKQLERLGGGVIDLNIAATEGKDSRSHRRTQHSSEKASSHNRKRFRNSDEEEESEVESESEGGTTSGDCSHEDDKQKPAFTNVCAPSLFDPSMKPPSVTNAPAMEVVEMSPPSDEGFTSYKHDCSRRSAFSRTSSTPIGGSAPDVNLTVGFGSLETPNSSLSKPMGSASTTCDTQMSLAIGSTLPLAAQIGTRPIHPSPYPMMPSLHPNAVAAAAAAVADAAVAAQSWGMAAAVAHAQAQVAAQVHAQAQVQVQAMAQAQAQAQSQQQVRACSSMGIPKKRRRLVSSESCLSRRRSVPGIVRPIALKPHC